MESTATVPPVATAVSVRNQPVSYKFLTIRLDLSRLRSFLLQAIPQHCPKEYELIRDAVHTIDAVYAKVMQDRMVRGSSSRLSRASNSRILGAGPMNSSTCCRTYEIYHVELSNCIAVLSRFLNSWTEHPTPQVMSEAHFLIGCINETLQQTHQAKKSYITALWIITAKSNTKKPSEILATTLHCLGRTYGVLGQHKLAKYALRKAQQQYMLLNVHRDHAVMIDVLHLIRVHQQKFVEQSRAEQSKYWSSSSSLSLSLESILEMMLEEDQTE
jgi:hypothetical protein